MKAESMKDVVVNKINEMILGNSQTVESAIARMVNEGKISRDFIVPLGTERRQEDPVVTFQTNGKVKMVFNGDAYNMHPNAVSQVSTRFGIPQHYLTLLAQGEEWQRTLAAENLNQHALWVKRDRALVRTIGEEVRGVLTPSYRRVSGLVIISAFLSQVQENGGYICNGFMDDTRMAFEGLFPEPILIQTPKNGERWVAFGCRISTSDYGDGALEVRAFILDGVCLNGLVRQSVLRKIHLGARLPDNLMLSERTYQLDSETWASAVTDSTKMVFGRKYIDQQIFEIERASKIDVDLDKELKGLTRANKVLKEEVEEIKNVFLQNKPDDGVDGEATLWKLVQGVTAIARNKDARRNRELQEVAGEILDRANE